MPTLSPPSQVPDQFANVYGLGNLQTIYPVGVSNRWVSAIFGVLLIVAAGLVTIYGLYITSVQVTRYGPVMLWKSIITPLIIAAALFGIGVLAAINAYRNWNTSAAVYENGLAYCDNGGLQTWPWHEIEWFTSAITKHYRNGIYTGTTYLYTLQKADGSKLLLNNRFKKIEELGRFINQKVAPLQYEKLRQQLRSGQSVRLGQVSIDQQSLTINKKSYAWNEIDSVGIRNGYINIKKKDGGWFSGASAAVASIPNIDPLLTTIDQIVKVKAG